MKTTIIAICFTFTFLFVDAQDAKQNLTPKSMGGGGFTIGFGYMNVSKMQVFAPSSIPKFSNNHFLLGGTGHGIINKLVIGGGGFAIIGDALNTDSTSLSLGGGVGTFDLGYLIVNKQKAKMYPMLGIGGSGFGINITKTSTIRANQVANDPGHEINISKGGFVADVSININYIPSMQYDEQTKSSGGFMTGLKIGYLYSIPSSNWKFGGGNITGGPNFGLNMVYVKLIIGGFGA